MTALRVFEPIEAFPSGQREALAVLVADPAAAAGVEEAERRAAWLRVLGHGDRGRVERERTVRSRVLRVDGSVLLSPLPAEPDGGADWLASPPSVPAVPGGPSSPAAPGPSAGLGAGPAPSQAPGEPSRSDRGQGRRSRGEPGHREPSHRESDRAASDRAASGRAESGRAESGPEESAARAVGGAAGTAWVGRDGVIPPRRHGLVRAWELPLAWLAVVRPEDVTRSGGPGRYVLPMSRARARTARVLRTLRSGLGDVDVTADTEGLARWLEGFHPRSWVEVDARPVAALVGGEDGAEDIRLGLECLTAGDTAGLAAAYQRLRRRSRRLEEMSLSS